MLRLAASLLVVLTGLAAVESALAQASREAVDPVGILVMAHGGTPEWDRAIAVAVEPLAREVPATVALGMADPETLSHALDSLRSRGVRNVAVVRMFVSGASFIDQTEYLLGLTPTAPSHFTHSHAAGNGGQAAAPAGPPVPIAHGLAVATHRTGLVDAEATARIVAERALAISRQPASESVLLIAHGMGDPEENDELLSAMEGIERRVATAPFHAVRSATLREDWADERAVAEREIRAFVEGETRAGRRVLVVPVRLFGFGPYAEVLDGLEYVQGQALVPHEEVTAWVRRTAEDIARANGWGGLGASFE